MPTRDDIIIAETRHWLTTAVIGLNLCPFARAVHRGGRVRYFVSTATSTSGLLADLDRELQLLVQLDENEVETTLLIHPFVLDDFLDFNQFLTDADRQLDTLGLVGLIQIASFHPQYQFADLPGTDIGNYTNRSPYPILHLLRESSMGRATQSMPDTSEIWKANLRTMQALGLDGWQALTRAIEGSPAPEPS